MQLTNQPGKLTLPFANSGAKNTIPVASQIGIVAGAASLTDGFPPLTRTPLAAGGTPPSGLDMNGILYELSAAIRWANAGGQYQWDSVFAADSNTGGYPQGALVLSTDGLGFWRSTADSNTANPETATALPTWAPQGFGDVTSVAMASANVTLTPLQAARPVIVITGTLTANLNLVFPVFAKEWRVINNATGAYAVTCKTSGGTGVTINNGDAQLVYGDGTNIVSMRMAGAVAVQQEANSYAQATGTVDAIVAAFNPAITATTLAAGLVTVTVMPTGANISTTPTFTPNTGVIPPATIVKGNNQALAAGDIAGANHPVVLMWSNGLSKWILLNPATGVVSAATVDNSVNDFRLTLTSGTPVTLADITGATTVYCTPYKGNRIALYDGANWNVRASAEFSKALGTLTSGLPYDVFCYDNAGTPTLEFLAWTNGTTRATALAYQDGILVKSGAATRRYLGTFYTTSTTQTEDSVLKRFLWNYYNRAIRPMARKESTATWTYAVAATWRQANGATANKVEVVVGVAEDAVSLNVISASYGSTAGDYAAVDIGINSTTTPAGTHAVGQYVATNYTMPHMANLETLPAVGYSYFAWLEFVNNTNVHTFQGNGGNCQSGIQGRVLA